MMAELDNDTTWKNRTNALTCFLVTITMQYGGAIET